jgi:hypothetical protein
MGGHEMMKKYKALQFANQMQMEESQRGTVIWRAHQGPMRVNKPGRNLSKKEKKAERKIKRASALFSAIRNGKARLRDNTTHAKWARLVEARTKGGEA